MPAILFICSHRDTSKSFVVEDCELVPMNLTMTSHPGLQEGIRVNSLAMTDVLPQPGSPHKTMG